MLIPRAAAVTAGVVVLVALGHPGMAFLVLAGGAVAVVNHLRRPSAEVIDPDRDSRFANRAPVDLDKAIGAIERIARLGATRRPTRKPRR